MPVLKSQFVPTILAEHPEFKGAAISECIEDWVENNDVLAHSHVHPSDPFVGWICFKGLHCLADDQLMRHELAHILTDHHHGHDDMWRDKVLELGGHLEGYHFHAGKFHYSVPCFGRKCVTLDGRNPDEIMEPWMLLAAKMDFARGIGIGRDPVALKERQQLIKKMSSHWFAPKSQPDLIKQTIPLITDRVQFFAFKDQVTYKLPRDDNSDF